MRMAGPVCMRHMAMGTQVCVYAGRDAISVQQHQQDACAFHMLPPRMRMRWRADGRGGGTFQIRSMLQYVCMSAPCQRLLH